MARMQGNADGFPVLIFEANDAIEFKQQYAAAVATDSIHLRNWEIGPAPSQDAPAQAEQPAAEPAVETEAPAPKKRKA